MIQRVQSLFLLLSMACICAMYFFPFAHTDNRVLGDISIYIGHFGWENNELNAIKQARNIFTAYTIIAAVAVLIQAYTLLSYKNRRRQQILCRLSSIIIIAFIVVVFLTVEKLPLYIDPSLGEQAPNVVQYMLPAGLPLISLVLQVLAQKYIAKDEALVRSMDRIR